MPTPTRPEDPETLETGTAAGRPERASAAGAVDRPAGRMGIDRLALILIVLTGTLSLISYQVHLAARNYDTFVIKQVVPSAGIQDRLARAFGYDPSAYDERWRATLGSPYFPEFDRVDRGILNATASDYLGIWYYTREIVSGRNPYADDTYFVTATQAKYSFPWGRTVSDPGLPDQAVGYLVYPPMGPILILPFYLPNYFASYALYLAALHVFAAWLAYLLVKHSPGYRLPVGLLALTLFLSSYPLGFLIDRGNIEGSVFILTALGLLAYGRGRHMTAAVCFGLAASGKVIPAVFLALFLLEGRFKALLVAIAVGAGATLAAMLFMHEPLVSLTSQILHNMDAVKRELTSNDHPRHFDHSFFALLNGVLFNYFPLQRATHLSARLAPFYSMGILASTGVILLLLRRFPFVNRVLVLTVMMLAFPQMSGDYKLIHLYIPFGMILLGAVRRGWATPVEVSTLVVLGLLFSPKAYDFGGYSPGYFLNSTLLGVLLLVGLTARFGGPEAPAGTPAGAR